MKGSAQETFVPMEDEVSEQYITGLIHDKELK
jgi:hypothetical protein